MADGTGQTETAGSEPVVDLFGYPDRAGRGQKGRPAFQVTPRDRNRVRLLLALGWGNPRIATALEISLPTLHRYFKVEMQDRSEMRDRGSSPSRYPACFPGYVDQNCAFWITENVTEQVAQRAIHCRFLPLLGVPKKLNDAL